MELSNQEIMEKINEARNFQKLGKFKEAEKVYSDSLINNGNSFDLIFSYALFSKDLKNFILAKRLLVNLTKKFPLKIRPYILISDILIIENRLLEAEQVLLLARNIDPRNSDLLYNFSRLYWSGKNFELALKKLDLLAEECWMIGDNLIADILGGKKCGLTTLYKYESKDETKIFNIIPDASFNAYGDILNLLKKIQFNNN